MLNCPRCLDRRGDGCVGGGGGGGRAINTTQVSKYTHMCMCVYMQHFVACMNGMVICDNATAMGKGRKGMGGAIDATTHQDSTW